MLREVQQSGQPATPEQQQVLARWSGWGAIPHIFDPARKEWEAERAELRSLVSDEDYAAARRTTLNAHYTDAGLVQAMWEGMRELGFAGGNILEPGCGSGHFIGFAPQEMAMHWVGVELDPTTAAIATHLHPQAVILNDSFADTVAPPDSFDAVIGNVPFGDFTLYDPVHNPQGLSIHNHFIVKSLALTRPGGIVMVITSRWTMDSSSPEARQIIDSQADLLGALRLPVTAHEKAAGTKVVTDILVLRKRTPGDPVRSPNWREVQDLAAADPNVDIPVNVNAYFMAHPEHVLGELGVRKVRVGPELTVTPKDGDSPRAWGSHPHR